MSPGSRLIGSPSWPSTTGKLLTTRSAGFARRPVCLRCAPLPWPGVHARSVTRGDRGSARPAGGPRKLSNARRLLKAASSTPANSRAERGTPGAALPIRRAARSGQSARSPQDPSQRGAENDKCARTHPRRGRTRGRNPGCGGDRTFPERAAPTHRRPIILRATGISSCDTELADDPWTIDRAPGYGPGASSGDGIPGDAPRQGPLPASYTDASDRGTH